MISAVLWIVAASMSSFLSKTHFFGVRYAGFKMVKLRGRSGMPVAFADFEVPCIESFLSDNHTIRSMLFHGIGT